MKKTFLDLPVCTDLTKLFNSCTPTLRFMAKFVVHFQVYENQKLKSQLSKLHQMIKKLLKSRT